MMSGSKGQNPIVFAQRGLRELRSNEAIRVTVQTQTEHFAAEFVTNKYE